MDAIAILLESFKSIVKKMVVCKDVDELFRNATEQELACFRSFGLSHMNDLVCIKRQNGKGYLFELDFISKEAITFASEQFYGNADFVMDVFAFKLVRMVQFHANRPELLPDNGDSNHLWCKINSGEWNEIANIHLNKKLQNGTASFIDEFGNIKGVDPENGTELIWDLEYFPPQDYANIKNKYESLFIYQNETEPYYMPEFLTLIIQKTIVKPEQAQFEMRFIENNFSARIKVEAEQHPETALAPLTMLYADIKTQGNKLVCTYPI